MYEVMVVDDDSTTLAIVKALLSNEYTVLTMKSGLQALGYMKTHKLPDIILLEAVMSSGSGMEFLKTVKKEQRLKDIPVMFLTNVERIGFELEGFTLGAVDFLQKPVAGDLLKIKIQRQISILELARENQMLRERLRKIKQQVNLLCDASLSSKDG